MSRIRKIRTFSHFGYQSARNAPPLSKERVIVSNRAYIDFTGGDNEITNIAGTGLKSINLKLKSAQPSAAAPVQISVNNEYPGGGQSGATAPMNVDTSPEIRCPPGLLNIPGEHDLIRDDVWFDEIYWDSSQLPNFITGSADDINSFCVTPCPLPLHRYRPSPDLHSIYMYCQLMTAYPNPGVDRDGSDAKNYLESIMKNYYGCDRDFSHDYRVPLSEENLTFSG